ncbi:LexA family transcriptional regulator [Pseudomonas fontis]|uniref:Transcriptional regulator n=1 Tax=Pseudomonas fontis TaxID=2942633 RepID=A0ABT5NNC8_9PSED|nr:XRE family transcriptional regulator [Pseudomonas fontis]MDD0973205.1 transcriptional regulator [Pseudomonas fontis]MDD0989663.1 transcriptional regulator [Pseudomonas fontis]
MKTSGDRLRVLLRECNLTASDFAAQRKVSPQHVNNWFHRGVPMARLDEIAELLCVRSKWLRSGEGPKHHTPLPRLSRSSDQPVAELPDHSLLAAHREDDVYLPFYRAQAKIFEPIPQRHLRIPRQALDSLGVSGQQALCLCMPDYNMAPLLPFGSTVAVDRSFTRVIDGEVYAVLHNGRLRIHSLSQRPNGALRLHSHDSDEFPCETYSVSQARNQGLEIVGWVFWWSQLRQERPG